MLSFASFYRWGNWNTVVNEINHSFSYSRARIRSQTVWLQSLLCWKSWEQLKKISESHGLHNTVSTPETSTTSLVLCLYFPCSRYRLHLGDWYILWVFYLAEYRKCPHFFDPWSIPSAVYPWTKGSHFNSFGSIHIAFNASGRFKVDFLIHLFVNPGGTRTFHFLFKVGLSSLAELNMHSAP